MAPTTKLSHADVNFIGPLITNYVALERAYKVFGIQELLGANWINDSAFNLLSMVVPDMSNFLFGFSYNLKS